MTDGFKLPKKRQRLLIEVTPGNEVDVEPGIVGYIGTEAEVLDLDAYVAAERERLAQAVKRDGFDPGKYTLTHPFSNCLRAMKLVRDDCARIVREGGTG